MDNSFTALLESTKTNNNDKIFYLKKGVNYLRILTQPVVLEEAYLTTEIEDKDGKKKQISRSHIVYKGCGYEQLGKTSFVTYVIDAEDQFEEDGVTPKIKTASFGWKVLESIVEQEKSRELQGLGRFAFPMTLDIIIQKTGEGKFNTKYGVSFMLSTDNNKIRIPNEKLVETLSSMPTLREWKQSQIFETMERHAKYGKPNIIMETAEPANPLPTVQLEDFDKEVEVPKIDYAVEEVNNLGDIPF